MNALVYNRHRPGYSLGEKIKLHEMKNIKELHTVFVFQKYGKFWSISLGHSIKHKPLISECFGQHDIFLKPKIMFFKELLYLDYMRGNLKSVMESWLRLYCIQINQSKVVIWRKSANFSMPFWWYLPTLYLQRNLPILLQKVVILNKTCNIFTISVACWSHSALKWGKQSAVSSNRTFLQRLWKVISRFFFRF